MCVSCDLTLSRLFCRALSLSVVSVVVVCSVSSSLVICYIYVIRGILLRAKWLHLSCLPSMSRPPAATPRSCPSRFQPPSSLPPRGAALTPHPRPASPRFQPSVRSPPSLRPASSRFQPSVRSPPSSRPAASCFQPSAHSPPSSRHAASCLQPPACSPPSFAASRCANRFQRRSQSPVGSPPRAASFASPRRSRPVCLQLASLVPPPCPLPSFSRRFQHSFFLQPLCRLSLPNLLHLHRLKTRLVAPSPSAQFKYLACIPSMYLCLATLLVELLSANAVLHGCLLLPLFVIRILQLLLTHFHRDNHFMLFFSLQPSLLPGSSTTFYPTIRSQNGSLARCHAPRTPCVASANNGASADCVYGTVFSNAAAPLNSSSTRPCLPPPPASPAPSFPLHRFPAPPFFFPGEAPRGFASNSFSSSSSASSCASPSSSFLFDICSASASSDSCDSAHCQSVSLASPSSHMLHPLP